MLKLPKGLKKKKKGKKSKKDQELFTEEEFEQYKREHQAHAPPEGDDGEHAQAEKPKEEKPKGENDEEWSRFAALTSDIDSILKRTQANLDHIKTTSFFQRVAPPSEKKVEERKRAEEEAEERRKQEEQARREQEEAERDPARQLLNAVVELSDSEDESEVDDSAFDTTFIDKVEAGELPLAYVREEEDEEEEADLGPDPFDTGYAEKVIKGPEVSARGKKIVDIGAAVSVLTGKAETSASTSSKSRRQRRGIQNLLLESFEVDQEAEAAAAQGEGACKTLLDEPAELGSDIPIDLSVSLHLQLQKKPQRGEDEPDLDLEEFDVVKDDDELLVAAKKVIQSEAAEATNASADLDWSEFELEREKPLRPPPPTRPGANILGSDDDFDLADDPFDTAYVEKIVPKQIDYDDDFDPRAAGEQDDDDDFNPRADEEEEDLFNTDRAGAHSLGVAKNDLLSASHSDLASIAPTLAPSADQQEEEEEIDPFDTSAVDKLVAPGKTELKYLERELLGDKKKKDSLSDDDFDPRAGEEEPRPSADEALRHRKSSLSLQIPGARLVSFSVQSPDLLKTDADASQRIQKPLTPYYTRESSLTLEEEEAQQAEVDPFDTSFVPAIAPTKVELDLIEREILKETKPAAPQSIDYDDDFDPRAITPEPPREKTDLLLAPDNHDIKVLTPAKESSTPEEAEEIDPFDTSIAANIVPGSIELKLLEDELIEKRPEAPPPTDILSDTQDHSIYVKILTPQPTGSLDEEPEDFDPFDTSFATNLAPGETEIKLIESEFIN